MRTAEFERTTRETAVSVKVNLDGEGKSEINTTIPFLDHMLTSIATHCLCDLKIVATGDLIHHISEDVAICLGAALRKALTDSPPITRFSYATIPMDCSLASASLDISNRPYSVVNLNLTGDRIEGLPTEDITHFMESLASNLRANLHVKVHYGQNDHHTAEAAFKALAVSLRLAFTPDPRRKTTPSSKGVL